MGERDLSEKVEEVVRKYVEHYMSQEEVAPRYATDKVPEIMQMYSAYLNQQASRKMERQTRHIIRWNRALAISTVVLAVATVFLGASSVVYNMNQSRPVVDYTISHMYGYPPPQVIDYRTSSKGLVFDVRNRGDTYAPVLIEITATDAYIIDPRSSPSNATVKEFIAVLAARTEDWSGWQYDIYPKNGASSFMIEFNVTKRWEPNYAGFVNWYFGEYHSYIVSVTYDKTGTDVYELRK